MVGASLSGCYIAAELSKLYPSKKVVLLERSLQLAHAGDDVIRALTCHPKTHLVFEQYRVPCTLSTMTPMISVGKTRLSSIHHPDFSTRPAVHEPKKESVRRLFTSDVIPSTDHDPFVVHESWSMVRDICQEKSIKQVLLDQWGDLEKVDDILANTGLPFYLCSGCPSAAVSSKIRSMDPMGHPTCCSENDLRATLVQGLMLGAEVKSFVREENATILTVVHQGQEKSLRCHTVIFAVPKEPLCRIQGWSSSNHPVRSMVKRMVTCRVDAEFRYPRFRSWLRDRKVLGHSWTPAAIPSVLSDRLDRMDFSTAPDTPSATPCRRANNTPAPPPSWWPLVTLSFPQHEIRVKVTANPHDADCGMISFHIDDPSKANAWFALQKEQGATAVRIAIYNFMMDLFEATEAPFSFWSRVVPIYTTVWRQHIGLPSEFLNAYADQNIFIAGRDYSTTAQGHAEGALQTGMLVIEAIQRKK